MGYTSVLLRCPDELYAWFEAELLPGHTVEQTMLAVLREWKGMNMAAEDQVARTYAAYCAAREAPSPASQIAPAPELSVMPQARGAKRRHTGGRRRGNRH